MPAFLLTSPSTNLVFNNSFSTAVLKPGLSNWQAALVSGANLGNLLNFGVLANGDSTIPGVSTVSGSTPIMNAMQIVKVVDFLQPAVLPTTVGGVVQNNGIPFALEYPNLPAGVYMLLHVHGAINTGSASPQYSGGWYSLTYNTGATVKRIKVNYPELGRYTSGQAASVAYSGNKTYFYNSAPGNIVLQYVNEGGEYGTASVTTDPNTVSTYVAHGLSYPAVITSATDPIAPVFALIQVDSSGGLNTTSSYVKPPIFIPSARTFANIGTGTPYNSTVKLGSQNSVYTYYHYYMTTDGSSPAVPTLSLGTATTGSISLSGIMSGPVKIRAVAITGGSSGTTGGTTVSPVAYIEYL